MSKLPACRHKGIVIAIDGPAGSGKSTIGRKLAAKLNLRYIDTGAMYRAVTLAVLKAGVDPHNTNAVAAIARQARIELEFDSNDCQEARVLLNGEDVTPSLRTPEVDKWVSIVSAVKEVRNKLVAQQRALVRDKGAVVDGRDIGTQVFPDATLKLFLTASFEERVTRRYKQLQNSGCNVSYESVRNDVLNRDEVDTSREISPLKIASDAFVVDSTHMTPEQVVEIVLDALKKRMGGCFNERRLFGEQGTNI